ncbi:PorP/SprF family type IX secretion system membrane protein [Luteibaculum oceani]|uniref:Type IX secretion system membrane protein PorP/SprF n=1 Tax=Luteibaculum oceani TaxID=1294296 RepID=A0A5C6VEV6_9FLAO|nr:type IX secretion system membrane protein PorP/SprF [Luteibaculum oceani]TXC81718.1 type IX secretion system membrane protein PorP/SprF [Luteibaculum oceani]
MKSLYRIFIASLLCLPFIGNAQQHPQYSLFMFNKQTINPGYVGSRNTFSINADYRTQWVGVEGNPETFNIGLHTPLGKGATIKRLAAGLLFSSENIGVQTRQGYSAQLAYRLPLGQKTVLSFGVEGSIYNISYETSKLRAENPDDQTINQLNQGISKPNVSAGVYVYHPNYFLGASSMLLLNKEREEGNDNDLSFRRHYFFMGGYLLPVSNNFKLRASTIVKYLFLAEANESPSNGDINLSGIIADRFLIGASYRTDGAWVAMAQIQLNKHLNVAYGYDFKTSNYASVAGVSHEVYLGIDIAGKSKPMTSPRFVTYF